jgi:E3 ubiquitin-protein ligase UBR4
MKQIRDLCNEGHCSQLSSPANLEAMQASLSPGSISMAYETRLTLIEHLKACAEIAASRTDNWQKFCLENDGVVRFLLTVSYQLDEGVAPLLLQLLQAAICSTTDKQNQLAPSSTGAGQPPDASAGATCALTRSSPSRARSVTPSAAGGEKKEGRFHNQADTG